MRAMPSVDQLRCFRLRPLVKLQRDRRILGISADREKIGGGDSVWEFLKVEPGGDLDSISVGSLLPAECDLLLQLCEADRASGWMFHPEQILVIDDWRSAHLNLKRATMVGCS